MHKSLGVLWVTGMLVGLSLAVTQEELAQYVAQQQTASLGASPSGGHTRRQAYLLQPQAKSAYQGQPQQQVYQFQSKAAGPQYQVASKYPTESEQQYLQASIQQPAAQSQYYQPRTQAPPRKLIRPQAAQQQLDQEQQEEYEPPQPYQFGFDIKDDEYTNYQNRKEQREGDKISGSYSVVDSDGYIRTVTYTADPVGGFKADVVREPTDIKVRIPQHTPLDQQAYSPGARKQQTQQYLQASQPKQQYALRPEHTQAVSGGQRQYAAPATYQQPQYHSQYQQ